MNKLLHTLISLSKYNAHTNPLFKSLEILKIFDIFKLYQLKFFHKFLNRKLPTYFQSLPFVFNENFHGVNTRQRRNLHINRVAHSFAEKCIRYNLPKLINDTNPLVFKKFFTHSFHWFSNYSKRFFISMYTENCEIVNCYICRHGQ